MSCCMNVTALSILLVPTVDAALSIGKIASALIGAMISRWSLVFLSILCHVAACARGTELSLALGMVDIKGDMAGSLCIVIIPALKCERFTTQLTIDSATAWPPHAPQTDPPRAPASHFVGRQLGFTCMYGLIDRSNLATRLAASHRARRPLRGPPRTVRPRTWANDTLLANQTNSKLTDLCPFRRPGSPPGATRR